MSEYILAIDQGTTSSRVIIYNRQLKAITIAQQEVELIYPQPGWVEQNPEQLWQSVYNCMVTALKQAQLNATDIAAIAITNQRETSLLWHKCTGKTLYNAIVWQDRRTAQTCLQLEQQGHLTDIQQRTGLRLDPYFSATKLAWLLDNIPDARVAADNAELCFGTVDSYLLWRLTAGKVHATDATNASRTLLFNLHTQEWDPKLLSLFDIPDSLLGEIKDNAAEFGYTDTNLFGSAIPIFAMIGDQQAALLGQACITPGMAKSTYGTGCFSMLNTGSKVFISQQQLISTLAWRLNAKPTYALEGSIFMAGAIVQWLRDKLGIIQQAADTEALAQQVPYQQSELLIPAFTGLGAPYWQPNAQAAIFGMTRNTGKAELAAAALLSVCYQSRDLLQAMAADGIALDILRVDGGMTENSWFLQALADITQQPLQRCHTAETSVLGAAFLAGLQLGYFTDLSDIQQVWQANQQYNPKIPPLQADSLYQRWQDGVTAIINK
ncbi:glycerol kinase GlpK [Rheinheimera salexigens]|uniref:glycerol kinase n=1 Tax=Rheinheimera salexigens TaxID=1628148 RepID=A0A1E7Q5L2_9GAMM|nr:glycerol kinase GlpK [Rheinheimera salexigens]OEY69455.1 glycerol kinase [Rheinheimera salexigens]